MSIQISPSIVASIDWFDVVFENCSIDDVLHHLELEDQYSIDYLETFLNATYVDRGYIQDLILPLRSGNLQIRGRELFDKFGIEFSNVKDFKKIDDFYQTKFSYIKVSFSGSAIQDLRSLGYEVNRIFLNPFQVNIDQSYHITRIDFAYDLLNYHGDFIDKCENACKRYGNKQTHCIATGQSAMSWECTSGRKRVFRLGKGASDSSLRIYDKLQEQSDKNNLSDYPYEDIIPLSELETWVRIELQNRRQERCHMLTYCQCQPEIYLASVEECQQVFLSVFRFIYDRFAIRVDSVSHANRQPDVSPAWKNLFDWESIPHLLKVKILSNSEKWQSPGERGLDYLKNNCLSSFICACNQYGLSKVIDELLGQFYSLQRNNDPFSLRRFKSIYSKLINWDLHSNDINQKNLFRMNNQIYVRENDKDIDSLYLINQFYDFAQKNHLKKTDTSYQFIYQYILYITEKEGGS